MYTSLLPSIFSYRTEKRAAPNKSGSVVVDPFEEQDNDDSGTSSEDKMFAMEDERLGPPFGIVINGHNLVSTCCV